MHKFSELESLLTSRRHSLFTTDIDKKEKQIKEFIENSSFLILGGAGSIGKSVVKEIILRKPRKIHIVDINENGLAELTRDIRSSIGYFSGKFSTFVCDIGSKIFDKYFMSEDKFDYVLNFTALKHVRSEKDILSLTRLIQVNIFNTKKVLELCDLKNTKKYFCVSTDKASSPVNFMGASKRIMELYLAADSSDVEVSTARFANVAFSDGSLPYSMLRRLESQQPLAVPKDIKRFFVSHKEAGELCLMSCLFGKNMEIYFPVLTEDDNAVSFVTLAEKLLTSYGFKVEFCETEQKARDYLSNKKNIGRYPVFLSNTDTTGEKLIEQFFSETDEVNYDHYQKIGIVNPKYSVPIDELNNFERFFSEVELSVAENKDLIRSQFKMVLPDFQHVEMGKSLEDKM